ncbi:hypothetical protein PP657_gp089 [Bacillus phage BCPST]|uniref:Uncharacterized protein n=1 Tax=Bacillus phage BCPST TaxID=2801506 RepID=A0AAE7PGS0_9CAUD|nr:hypothetical protein PP657_gp089 [Bacillus phage BCPST]QQO38707.1 hypothetical protein BCPST_089 [Bacillus phage BCPST]QSJ04298.1 hypothetical protein BCP6_093 [Bacillus phage BCP6]
MSPEKFSFVFVEPLNCGNMEWPMVRCKRATVGSKPTHSTSCGSMDA